MSTACCALFSTTFEAQDLQRARRCTFSNIYGGDPASGDGVDVFSCRVVLHVSRCTIHGARCCLQSSRWKETAYATSDLESKHTGKPPTNPLHRPLRALYPEDDNNLSSQGAHAGIKRSVLKVDDRVLEPVQVGCTNFAYHSQIRATPNPTDARKPSGPIPVPSADSPYLSVVYGGCLSFPN